METLYNIFGLLVKSELALPGLATNNSKPDVFVKFGTITDKLDKTPISGICYQVGANKFLLEVNGVAQFLVENGSHITIDASEGGSDEEIRLFLLGSAFGALIHQRGLLPIHGSAIVMHNRAIIFSGFSGAGKSTLAAGFIKRGYQLLADDVCVVTINNEGKPIIHPGYPQMKLWADSLENLGHKPLGLQKVRTGIKKYALPLNHEFYNEATELMGMYVISKQNIEKIKLQALTGIEKFNMVNSNTYRLNFLKGNGPTEAHFKHIEAVSRLCFVKHLYRPQHGFFIDQLIDLIEYDLKTRCLIQ